MFTGTLHNPDHQAKKPMQPDSIPLDHLRNKCMKILNRNMNRTALANYCIYIAIVLFLSA